MKVSRAKLKKEEWDFFACPDDELRLCFYYEHFREIKGVRNLFRKFGRKSRKGLTGDKLNLLEEFNNLVAFLPEDMTGQEISLKEGEEPIDYRDGKIGPIDLLTTILEINVFPKTPWLCIPYQERTRIRKKYYSDIRSSMRVNVGLTPDDLQKLAKLRQESIDARPEIILSAGIPLGLELNEIIEILEDELRAFAQTHPQNFIIRLGGKGGYMTKLKNLGALRLLNRMSPEKALRKITTRDKPLYIAKREFLIAKKSAEQVLLQLVKPGILPGEK